MMVAANDNGSSPYSSCRIVLHCICFGIRYIINGLPWFHITVSPVSVAPACNVSWANSMTGNESDALPASSAGGVSFPPPILLVLRTRLLACPCLWGTLLRWWTWMQHTDLLLSWHSLDTQAAWSTFTILCLIHSRLCFINNAVINFTSTLTEDVWDPFIPALLSIVWARNIMLRELNPGPMSLPTMSHSENRTTDNPRIIHLP